ncbi:MAG: DinB family protein [Candidatus Hydrogenedentota bacterium]
MGDVDEKRAERLKMAFLWIDSHKDKSVDELKTMFSERAEAYVAETSELSAEQFDYKPSDTEWSIREVSLHVAHSIAAGGSVIPILAGGTALANDVKLGQMISDPGNQASIGKSVEAAFGIVLAAMESLEVDSHLEATFKHPFFGPINCRQTAAFNILHLDIHVKQVQRVKAYDSFPA